MGFFSDARCAVASASLASALAFCPVPASAALLNITFTGTVAGNYDQTGQFGPVDASNNLVGSSFIISFVVNTSLGHFYSSAQPYPYEGITGGSDPKDPSPIIKAVASINGIDAEIPLFTYSDITIYYDQDGNPEYRIIANEAYNDDVRDYSHYMQASVYDKDRTFSPTLDYPGTAADPSGSMSYGLSSYNYQTGLRVNNYVFGIVNGFTVSTVIASPAPEASTWTMMILGLAGLGYVGSLRRSAPRTSPPRGLA